MTATLISSDSGFWITAATLAAIVLIAAAGCWFGAPPDTRRQIVRGIGRDFRREWAIRQWKRQQRKVRVTR